MGRAREGIGANASVRNSDLRRVTSSVLPVEIDECSKGCLSLSDGVVSAHTSSPHVARGLPNVHSVESSPVLCALHFFFSHLRSAHASLLPKTVHACKS